MHRNSHLLASQTPFCSGAGAAALLTPGQGGSRGVLLWYRFHYRGIAAVAVLPQLGRINGVAAAGYYAELLQGGATITAALLSLAKKNVVKMLCNPNRLQLWSPSVHYG